MTIHTEQWKKVSVVVPLHNEQDNINFLVSDLLKKYPSWEIILMDDYSTDRTPEIVNNLALEHKNIHAIHRIGPTKGMGYALMEGTLKATGTYVAWVMGDRSDNLDTLEEMYERIEDGAHMVIGSRYMEGGDSGDLNKLKALYSSSYTQVARLRYGLPVHDITNAFRMFLNGILLECLPLKGNFAISPQFAIKAHQKGYKLDEVPTTYHNRKFGKTNFKMLRMGWEYGKLLI